MDNNNNEITFLHVPFAEKDKAKSLGARWSATDKKWFVPAGVALKPFSQWLKAPATIEKKTLDTSRWVKVPEHSPKLYVDLVPKTGWYSNLRSELATHEWDLIRHTAYKLAGNKCEICGESGFAQGKSHAVECHERWTYDNTTLTQTLAGVQALCPNCHTATHMGLANIRGQSQEATVHLATVNGWSAHETNEHVQNAFADWIERSEKKWRLDMSWLLAYENELSTATVAKVRQAMASDGSDRKMANARIEERWEGQSEEDMTGAEIMAGIMSQAGII